MTDNHSYTTPREGTVDWHVPLNNNFVTLDTDVEIRDTAASRDNYVPKDGAKFLATNTGEVYLGDGSNWTRIGDVRRADGAVIVQSDVPASPTQDDLWVDVSGPDFLFYDGSQWVSILGGGTVDGSDGSSSGESGVVFDAEGDLSAFSGDGRFYSITSNALSGSGSLLAKGVDHPDETQGGGYRTIASTDGLPLYPSAGDTFSVDLSIETKNTYGAILFGVQSESSPWPGYRLRMDTGATPGVEFARVRSGDPVESHNLDSNDYLFGRRYHDDASYEPTVGQRYTVTVDWGTDGTIAVKIVDSSGSALLSASTTDTSHTDGGVGFMSSSSWPRQDENEVRYDNYEVL
jgi:hypothetical protein